MALVSFVIPAFNQGRFVAQAIDSALAQTHPEVEVVVVNDGSTDDTAAVLKPYRARPNVRVIEQANAGLPAARNVGLAASLGAYVCFLDADDAVMPAFAARLTDRLDADPALAFAYSDVQWVDVAGAPAGDYSVASARRTLTGDIFESLMIGGYFPPVAALVRRSALNELGDFDRDLGGHADYELWLRLIGAGRRASFVGGRLALYRVHDGSMSRNTEHMRQSRIAAIARIARRYPERVGRALSALQEFSQELHAANEWLNSQWSAALRAIEAEHGARWSLLEHLGDAKLTSGTPDKMAVWNSKIDGVSQKGLLLHPHAALSTTLPTQSAGRLMTAVAIHPDAWSKPDAGVCQFSLVVNGRQAASTVLDPRNREADRRWVEIAFDVPASPEPHAITLETRSIGPDFFCWALFRDVTFVESR